ncbi:MAG: MarR family transcriptional regulator [Lachnospiraceae bacterium]|nr:MarR family transcriptional regulator [Lachnospiraceae bacterium]
MKSSEPEVEKIFKMVKQKRQNEGGIMKAIMDFNCIHMKMNFGGLSTREFMMLDLLSECRKYKEKSKEAKKTDGNAGIRVSEMTRFLGLSMPQVSRLLGSMESKGYIERRVNDKDRRSTYVSITDQGMETREQSLKECKAYMDSVIITMGQEKTDQLIHLLEEFTQIMREERKKKM